MFCLPQYFSARVLLPETSVAWRAAKQRAGTDIGETDCNANWLNEMFTTMQSHYHDHPAIAPGICTSSLAQHHLHARLALGGKRNTS